MERATYRAPGLLMTEHEFAVPLDHDDPGGEQISVFAREVVAPRKRDRDLPWLLFLQGGPGQPATRPVNRSGWLGRALLDHRVLLLDQRGVGRSTPQNRQSLAAFPPAEQARRLSLFRADSIVRDAELVRRELLGDQQWTVLGQSFGGFCTLTYLSFAPEGVRAAVITGGVPATGRTAEEVYDVTYDRVAARYRRFLARYPEDGARFDAVADRLAEADVRLPCGDRLTVERLQSLGLGLGMSDHNEKLHYLLETAWVGDQLSDEFLMTVERMTTFADKPLYLLLHEACYADGPGATRWAAQRVRDKRPVLAVSARPLAPTGEMVYPWAVEQEQRLAPLADAAHLLAEKTDWPRLYDLDRLATNTVPVAAAVYHDDMYVDYGFSMETARRVGRCEVWVTNEYAHDGLRSDSRVLDRLLDVVAGEAGTV